MAAPLCDCGPVALEFLAWEIGHKLPVSTSNVTRYKVGTTYNS